MFIMLPLAQAEAIIKSITNLRGCHSESAIEKILIGIGRSLDLPIYRGTGDPIRHDHIWYSTHWGVTQGEIAYRGKTYVFTVGVEK